MRVATRCTPVKRYRAVIFSIPITVALYLGLLSLKPTLSNTRDAAFPVFSWALFAETPPWITHKNVVVAHSVDGREVRRYLIPARSPAPSKSLRQAVEHCQAQPYCDDEVRNLLYPIVTRLAGGRSIEFTIAIERVDLRKVRADIHAIAAGSVSKFRHLERQRTFGRWSTAGGRIGIRELDATQRVFESRFDGYVVGPCGPGRCLVYVKDPCAESDLGERFFLNVIPRDGGELPDGARARGYEAFRFAAEAEYHGTQCKVTRTLPDYDIAEFETGQYRPGESRVWTERVTFPERPISSQGR